MKIKIPLGIEDRDIDRKCGTSFTRNGISAISIVPFIMPLVGRIIATGLNHCWNENIGAKEKKDAHQ
jgi:hypothetical protein